MTVIDCCKYGVQINVCLYVHMSGSNPNHTMKITISKYLFDKALSGDVEAAKYLDKIIKNGDINTNTSVQNTTINPDLNRKPKPKPKPKPKQTHPKKGRGTITRRQSSKQRRITKNGPRMTKRKKSTQTRKRHH